MSALSPDHSSSTLIKEALASEFRSIHRVSNVLQGKFEPDHDPLQRGLYVIIIILNDTLLFDA